MLERLSWLAMGFSGLGYPFTVCQARKVCRGSLSCKIGLPGVACSGLDFRDFCFLGLAFENFFKKKRARFLLGLRAF